MDTNDDKEYDEQKYQLITTDGEENDETKYPINTAKSSPSAAQVFPSAKVPASLSSISLPMKQSPISEVTVFTTVSPVMIVTRAPIDKGEKTFKPVTTTVYSGAKGTASVS